MAPRSALLAVLRPGHYGATQPDGAGIMLRERRGHTAWIVINSNDAGAPSADANVAVLGLALHRWLVIGDVAPATGDVVTVSGAWTQIAVSGRNAADLLSKACAIDLAPEAFAAGAVAQTRFAGLHAVLRRLDDADSYEILIARSQAAWLWDWLMEASLEFGVEVA